MIPVIRWSLWERRWSILGWSLGIAAYMVITISVYSSLKGQTADLTKALSHLPASVQALFGSNDFLSPTGYLTSKIYYPILPLLLTIFAISLSGHLLASEEQDGTLELLLARPISRSRLLFSKLAAGLLAVTAVTLVSLITILLCCQLTHLHVPILRNVSAMAASLLLALLFGSIAWAMTAFARLGRRASVGIATLVTVGSYLIASLESFANWLVTPAKFMPFHYYHPSDILTGSTAWGDLVGLAAVSVVLVGIAWVGFRRRDIG